MLKGTVKASLKTRILITFFVFVCLGAGLSQFLLEPHVRSPWISITAAIGLMTCTLFVGNRLKRYTRQVMGTVETSVTELVHLKKEKEIIAAEKGTLEAELELANQVQTLLLPPEIVNFKNEVIHSHWSAAEKCGGDWWGCLDVVGPKNRPVSVLMIGDVTGHGVHAALLTGVIRGSVSILKNWIREKNEIALDPRNILHLLNNSIYESAHGSITMTFFVATIDHANEKLYCANAGHSFPYLIVDGKISSIGGTGVTLGDSPDTVFDDLHAYDWKPGNKLFLYTDGLIDLMDGEINRFDRRHLRRILQKHGTSPGRELLKEILDFRNDVGKNLPQRDDITVVICDALPLEIATP